MASCASSRRELRQLVEEVVVHDAFEEGHHLWMRADHVRDVEEREPHLRRHVVGHGLREDVGRVLLAQPLLQMLVEPHRGLHRLREHPMAERIEQDPLQLRDVFQDEVEQRCSRPRPDVACHGGVRSLAALDQVGDDRRIGLDRDWRTIGWRCTGRLVPERGDEVAAVKDGLQSVADQRIGSPQCIQDPCATRRRCQALGDVHEQPSAGVVHRRAGRQLPEGEPKGLDGVGHHLLVTDRDVNVVLTVVRSGNWEQRRDRPALDDLELIIDQAPFDVLRATEMRFDPPAQSREPNDLRIGQRGPPLLLRFDQSFLRPA